MPSGDAGFSGSAQRCLLQGQSRRRPRSDTSVLTKFLSLLRWTYRVTL